MGKYTIIETAEYEIEAESEEQAESIFSDLGPETSLPCTVIDRYIELM